MPGPYSRRRFRDYEEWVKKSLLRINFIYKNSELLVLIQDIAESESWQCHWTVIARVM